MIGRLVKRIKIYYLPFILFFIVSLLIMFKVEVHSGDDLIFTEAFRNYGGAFNWVKSYINIWSGRVIPHFILIVLLNKNLIIWKILNSIVLTMLSISIFSLIDNRNIKSSDTNKVILGSIICGCILLLPASVFTSGITWITGSVTYLWSTTFAIIAIIPFKRLLTGEKIGKVCVILSIMSSLYASNVEQPAAVMTAFSALILVYAIIKKNENIKIYHFFMIIIMIVFTLISLGVPGNSVRFDAELLLWYPNFNMLSIIDKLFMGISNTLNHIFNRISILMLILTLLLMIITMKKFDEKIVQVTSSIPFLYQLLKLCSVEFLFNYSKGDKLINEGIVEYIGNIFGIFVLIIIVYLLFLIFDTFEESITPILLFMASICSSLSISISPTIFASGNRVFFVTDILILICIYFLFYELIKKYYKNIKLNNNLFIMYIIIIVVVIINTIINIAPKLIL